MYAVIRNIMMILKWYINDTKITYGAIMFLKAFNVRKKNKLKNILQNIYFSKISTSFMLLNIIKPRCSNIWMCESSKHMYPCQVINTAKCPQKNNNKKSTNQVFEV